MAIAVFVLVVWLLLATVAGALAVLVAAGLHPNETVGERRRLTHRETAAVEDAIVLTAALAAQVGTVLHILRRGPDAYPVDLPAGALWRAALEALEREGHLTLTETQAGANGHKGIT